MHQVGHSQPVRGHDQPDHFRGGPRGGPGGPNPLFLIRSVKGENSNGHPFSSLVQCKPYKWGMCYGKNIEFEFVQE